MERKWKAVDRIVASMLAALLVASMTLIPAMTVSARVTQLSGEPVAETLASVAVAKGGEGRLVLMRFTLEPGATIRAHSHSGPAAFTVIAGVLTTELVRGSAIVNRDGIEESAEVGDVNELADGASIVFAPNAGETMENRGDEPLLLVASLLLKTNEPIFEYDSWPPPHTTAR